MQAVTKKRLIISLIAIASVIVFVGVFLGVYALAVAFCGETTLKRNPCRAIG